MKTLIAIPSKQRPDIFQKICRPFVDALGLDTILVLEPEDYHKYEYPNKLLLKKSNAGLGYALTQVKEYAASGGYDLIFKIDDDVSGIGKISDDIDTIISYFKRYPKLGAVVFPYDFEFYAKSTQLFTHTNKRTQTCYLIRTSAYHPREDVSTFEDFYNFLQIVKNNMFTLFCARHQIKCKPVGGGSGGCQTFDRKEQAKKEILIFQSIDPTIDVIVKKNKSWYYEPKFTGPQYKSKKIK